MSGASALATAARSRWAPIILAAGAAVTALAVNHFVYPGLSWNRDEPVYLWQAEILRAGRLTVPDGGFPELLHPWLSGWRDGMFFTQYPLGWPLVILAATLAGWPALAPAAGAALAVAGTYHLTRELFADELLASAAAVSLLVSPVIAVQGGLYLNYLFSLGLGLYFLTFFVSGVRRGSHRRIVAAAALLGWIVMTRSFDAICWAVAATAFVGFTERGRWRSHLRLAVTFLTVFVPFVVAQLLHNRYLTGDPFEFPITVADPLDRYGFGERRLMPTLDPVQYGPRKALYSSAKNTFMFFWFLGGSYLGGLVALWGLWRSRRVAGTWLLAAIVVVFPLGYLYFWGSHISSLTARLSSPIYYIPLYAPVCILMAIGLVELARSRRGVGLVVLAAMLVTTLPLTLGRLGLNRELSRGQLAWRDSTDSLVEPSIVITASSAYLMYLNPFTANSPDGEPEVLYATNTWPTLIELLEAHPDRRAYLQQASLTTEDMLPSERPTRYEVRLEPVTVLSSAAVRLTLRAEVPEGEHTVSAYTQVLEHHGWRPVEWGTFSGQEVELNWILVPAGEGSGSPDEIELPIGELTLAVGVGFGVSDGWMPRIPLVRHQYHVRVSHGLVEVLLPGVSSVLEDLPAPRRWLDLADPPGFEVLAEPLEAAG